MSDKKKFMEAVKAVNDKGVAFSVNAGDCCRGCLTDQELGLESNNSPYGYTFGAQDMGVKWNRQGESKVDFVYVYFGNGEADGLDVPQIIVDAFDDAGLRTEWDGKQSSAIKVHFV